MLALIDESGDTGLKLEKASSRFFVVSVVLFADLDAATSCDTRIALLRQELGYKPEFEFHFAHNSDKVRGAFLQAVSPYNFTYLSVVINKDPSKLFGQGFKYKKSFYKYACNMLVTNALPYLRNATVIIDKSGSPDFRAELYTYLRRNFNSEDAKVIKKFKQQDSGSNNLLQLVDYVSGVINRKMQEKADWPKYHKFLGDKEISVQTWPKK